MKRGEKDQMCQDGPC